jgi:hypothetical protein
VFSELVDQFLDDPLKTNKTTKLSGNNQQILHPNQENRISSPFQPKDL